MATIVGRMSAEALASAEKHSKDLAEKRRREEVRRRFKRVQRLNREAEGWEPGFHNRIRGFRGNRA